MQYNRNSVKNQFNQTYLNSAQNQSIMASTVSGASPLKVSCCDFSSVSQKCQHQHCTWHCHKGKGWIRNLQQQTFKSCFSKSHLTNTKPVSMDLNACIHLHIYPYSGYMLYGLISGKRWFWIYLLLYLFWLFFFKKEEFEQGDLRVSVCQRCLPFCCT